MRKGIRSRVSITAPLCAAMATLVLCLAAYAMALSSEDLIITPGPDALRLSAPRVHFLVGQSLSHLHDGMSVPFDFQVTLFSGSRDRQVWRTFERFVVSYDLWEERFAVSRLSNSRRSVSHLLPSAAERWCFEQIAVPTAGVARDAPLWLRLEIRSEDQRDGPPVLADSDGISIASLIEVFSHPVRRTQQRWFMNSGPFRLAEFER
ncbi:MAG TPA: hypothetical protein VFA04_00210 [Bryobacteraceae bacterium]|nr:hypothetical protein [Bryobacteraceae bacterium]